MESPSDFPTTQLSNFWGNSLSFIERFVPQRDGKRVVLDTTLTGVSYQSSKSPLNEEPNLRCDKLRKYEVF